MKVIAYAYSGVIIYHDGIYYDIMKWDHNAMRVQIYKKLFLYDIEYRDYTHPLDPVMLWHRCDLKERVFVKIMTLPNININNIIDNPEVFMLSLML